MRDHHRFLLQRLLIQWRFLIAEIAVIDQHLEHIGDQEPELAAAIARWVTVPGIDRVAAWSLVAEIGVNMSQFPTASHLASWAGVFLVITRVQAKDSAARCAKAVHGYVGWPANLHGQLHEPRTLISLPSFDGSPVSAGSSGP